MLAAIKETLDSFRAGRRDGEHYRISKKIQRRILLACIHLTKDRDEQENLFQDLENLAYMVLKERYAWFRDEGLWDRAWGIRHTRIRSDLKEGVADIVREDNDLKAFLIGIILLEFCEECNGDLDAFWEKVGREIHVRTGKDIS
jgi:hypothetical protein